MAGIDESDDRSIDAGCLQRLDDAIAAALSVGDRTKDVDRAAADVAAITAPQRRLTQVSISELLEFGLEVAVFVVVELVRQWVLDDQHVGSAGDLIPQRRRRGDR